MISSILAPIFVFAVVVIVHEGGHPSMNISRKYLT